MKNFKNLVLALPVTAVMAISFAAPVFADSDGNESMHQALGTKLADGVEVLKDGNWSYTFATWDDGCGAGALSTVTVTKEPEHGTASVGPGDHTVYNPLSTCVGKVIKGTKISYVPAKGYTGKDSVTYTVDRQETVGGTSGTNTYTVPLFVK